MTARRTLPQAPGRRGWCPSLSRPMPTGDGLLARVHPALGILTVGQARAVAEGARRFGNGHVDVTARANLQIRGVTEATRAPLAALLDAAGLGDVRSDGGPQRLTLTAPLAGPEVIGLARAIEAVGLAVPGLPAKTLVSVEDAEPPTRPVVAPGPGSPCADAPGVRDRAVGFTGADADIRLLVIQDDTTPFPGRAQRRRSPIRGPAGQAAQRHDQAAQRHDQAAQRRDDEPLTRPVVAPGPGSPCADATGVRDRAGSMGGDSIALAIAGPDGPEWFAPLSPGEAIAAADAACRALAASGARRMRDLPAGGRVRLIRERSLVPFAAPPAAPARFPCGISDLGDGRAALLIDAPFGRCDAQALDRLADRAEALASDIHLSPSRGFVLVATDRAAAHRARVALAEHGFVVDPDDPRGAVAACPGAPACASGSTATLDHAARLAQAFAPFAARGLRAHVSGCAKGCAHPQAADLTLVGDGGLYGIVPGGPPSALPAMRLTFEAALERLRRADPDLPPDRAFRIQP